MTPREVWCNESQERYVLAIAPDRRSTCFRAHLRARALPVRGGRRGDRRPPPRGRATRCSATAGGHGPARAPRQAAAHDARRARACAPELRPFSAEGIDLDGGRATRAAAPRPSPTRRSWSRSATAPSAACARATRWSARGRCRSPTARRRSLAFERLRGRGVRDGRAHAARRRSTARPRAAWPSARRSPTSPRRRSRRSRASSSRPTGWPRPARPARTRRSSTPSRRWRSTCARSSASASRSARTRCRCAPTWQEDGRKREVVAPLSLDRLGLRAVRRRARHADAAAADRRGRDRRSCSSTSPAGRHRLGGSILAQVFGQTGDEAPDVDEPARHPGALRGARGAARGRARARLPRPLRRRPVRDARARWRSPAAPASTIDLDAAGRAREADRRRQVARRALQRGARASCCRCARADRGARPRRSCAGHGLAGARDRRAERRRRRPRRPRRPGAPRRAPAPRCSALWSRDDAGRCRRCATTPSRARQEYDRILDAGDPGLVARADVRSRPRTWRRRSSRAARGRAIAILREQGVNGQVEMAAAFDRAGFEALDVHMSDVIAGRVSLADFAGFAACGGFSYGDVLGGGEGWAKSILFNPRARDEFAGVLRAAGHLRARRLQRLPDDERARASSIPGAAGVAALREEPLRAVRGAAGAGRDPAEPVALLRGHGGEPASRSSPPTARAGRSSTRRARGPRRDRARCASSTTAGARPRPTRCNPNGSPRRHHGRDDGRRPLHDRDAAPRARLPHGADVVAPGRLGRGQPLDAPLPQRARLGRLAAGASPGGWHH